ncbi:glycerophosphodiester phosphodiesterase [Thermodesulfobacteriota bacterium]
MKTTLNIHPNKARPWIIAHRGACREAPENTRSAFDRALSYNIDGLELDIQMTRDGRPVLFHDRTLFKINGRRKQIRDYTYEQLRDFDWGAWYASAYTGEPLLTLEETLRSYSRRTRLLIEIKSRKPEKTSGRSLELTDKVLKEISLRVPPEYINRIFILSFDRDVLEFAFQKTPGLNYVLNLSASTYGPASPSGVISQPPAENDFLHAFCVKEKFLSRELVAFAHKRKKRVMTYACNILRQANHALSLNVDAIMTDKSDWLTRVFQVNSNSP